MRYLTMMTMSKCWEKKMFKFPDWFHEWIVIIDEPNKYGVCWELKKETPKNIQEEFKRLIEADKDA